MDNLSFSKIMLMLKKMLNFIPSLIGWGLVLSSSYVLIMMFDSKNERFMVAFLIVIIVFLYKELSKSKE